MTSSSRELIALIRTIALRDENKTLELLEKSPALALKVFEIGASRQAATDFFIEEIGHYVYAGDTALHIAAAAYAHEIAQKLLALGAKVRAKNRRGAEPLHYAMDGNPESKSWDPAAQAAIIKCLIKAGADPNAVDKSGVAPLHRAVRTRCSSAVQTLLANGADPRRFNGSGSTPLHLAVQNTGRGGSGSPAAQEQQREIILLLLKHGARPEDKSATGKSVTAVAGTSWILDILREA